MLIFISHSSTDTWVARQIAREVKSRGARTFLYETDVDVGEDFEEKILSSLENADQMLVLLTPWAMDRLYVWAEVGAAWGLRIPIFPFLYGETPAEFVRRSGVPVFLKKRDLLDINQFDVYLKQLETRMDARAARIGTND